MAGAAEGSTECLLASEQNTLTQSQTYIQDTSTDLSLSLTHSLVSQVEVRTKGHLTELLPNTQDTHTAAEVRVHTDSTLAATLAP